MNYFFDTSALFKLFVDELNASQVQAIYADSNNDIWVSNLTRPEFYSTVMRRFRGSQLSKIELYVHSNSFILLSISHFYAYISTQKSHFETIETAF